MLADVGGPVGPFLWIGWALVWVIRGLYWVILRITENVIVLGLWWVVFYWLLLFMLLHLGSLGSGLVRETRQGNDYLEFDPSRRGGDWAGRRRVAIVRLQIKLESTLATSSLLIGYLGAGGLLLVGFLGLWLAPVLSALVLRRALRVRQARKVSP